MILPPDKLTPVTNLEFFLMNPTPLPWGELLAPFVPPLSREGRVVFASYFGDVFVEDGAGAVWWVNGLEARIDRIAENVDMAVERVSAEHLVMLKSVLMEQLIRADMLLPHGMIYGLKTTRADGGAYHPDNVGTAPIADAFAFMGQNFQIANAARQSGLATAGPLAMPILGEKNDEKKGLWGKKK